jgi:hypothetical protein
MRSSDGRTGGFDLAPRTLKPLEVSDIGCEDYSATNAAGDAHYQWTVKSVSEKYGHFDFPPGPVQAAPPPARPQGPCPIGLSYIGDLYSQGHEVKARPSITIPFELDTGYQQDIRTVRGSGGDATTKLGSQQIPPGIFVIPSGDVFHYGWAVSDPVVRGNQFEMYLYCSPGSAEPDRFNICSVTVKVCGKAR